MPVIIDLGRAVFLLEDNTGQRDGRAFQHAPRLPPSHRCSDPEAPAFNYAPRLPSGVGPRVEPIVASFYSHQPAQAKKAKQSDIAIVVMIFPVSPTSVGRAGR